jgi:ankyrin repeat protein
MFRRGLRRCENNVEKLTSLIETDDIMGIKVLLRTMTKTEKNVRLDNGLTVLHTVVKRGKMNVVYELAADEDVGKESRDATMSTPLLTMAQENLDVRVLLYFGANPNVSDENGRTPLHYAIHNNNAVNVQQLLDSNANVMLAGHGIITPVEMVRNSDKVVLIAMVEEKLKLEREMSTTTESWKSFTKSQFPRGSGC